MELSYLKQPINPFRIRSCDWTYVWKSHSHPHIPCRHLCSVTALGLLPPPASC